MPRAGKSAASKSPDAKYGTVLMNSQKRPDGIGRATAPTPRPNRNLVKDGKSAK